MLATSFRFYVFVFRSTYLLSVVSHCACHKDKARKQSGNQAKLKDGPSRCEPGYTHPNVIFTLIVLRHADLLAPTAGDQCGVQPTLSTTRIPTGPCRVAAFILHGSEECDVSQSKSIKHK